MKKVTLIVPDKIIHVTGTTSSSRSKEIETDSKNIINALESNDYHDNYYFPINSVNNPRMGSGQANYLELFKNSH